MKYPQLLEFLKQHVSLCKYISAEHIRELADGARVVSFEASEAIAHQGDEAAHFGVLLSGTINVSVLGDAGTRQSLGNLNTGDTFGEAALMTGNPLPADFIAESRCEVLLIPVSLFQSVIVAEPGAVQHISRTIAERMKAIMADPAKAAAALRQSDDPYGLRLKGQRPEKLLSSTAAPRRSNTVSTTPPTSRTTRAVWWSASAWTARSSCIVVQKER